MAEQRWHIVLHDFGAISGQIEWDEDRITDAAWHMDRAWGRWHDSMPGTTGAVLLSDAMIAYVYDRKISMEAPAYTLTPNAKQQRIVRRRPE